MKHFVSTNAKIEPNIIPVFAQDVELDSGNIWKCHPHPRYSFPTALSHKLAMNVWQEFAYCSLNRQGVQYNSGMTNVDKVSTTWLLIATAQFLSISQVLSLIKG